ncbi:MAG: helix-turn-helix domain-containing protein [Rhodocyclaceae bacterium]
MPPKSPPRDAAILREAMRLFMFEQRRLLSELDAPQARMLIVLLRKKELLQSELGRLLGLEKSWVSRAVRQAGRAGLGDAQHRCSGPPQPAAAIERRGHSRRPRGGCAHERPRRQRA